MEYFEDQFGRRFPYLRLSITDVCNFSCSYCLPHGYQKTGKNHFLTPSEIRRLVTAFAQMGTWKIRLTGGEPTVRPDFIEIAKTISAVPGIRRLAVTTNGYKLAHHALAYYQAGIRAINVSIDSLHPTIFKKITGHDRLHDVLNGVRACIQAGYESVKINTVLLKNLNHHELDQFIEFVEQNPVSLRFIELMKTGTNTEYFNTHHISSRAIMDQWETRGWMLKPREEGAGPANVFEKKACLGSIGLIAPYSKDFCKTCNRLRISARGDLQLCLFGEGGFNLRPFLQEDNQIHELQEKIADLLKTKKETHFLHQGFTGATPHLASIGG